MKSDKREQTIMIAILVIFAAIAIIGLLLALGVVNTGAAWQAPATTSSCPAGWISAWAHSTNHSDMLKAGYGCTQSIVRGMVCCMH